MNKKIIKSIEKSNLVARKRMSEILKEELKDLELEQKKKKIVFSKGLKRLLK